MQSSDFKCSTQCLNCEISAATTASKGFGDKAFRLAVPAASRRVLLKVSGEALQGGMGAGVEPKVGPALYRQVLCFHSEWPQLGGC